MKSSDKFLIGIVVGIVLLIVVAFVVVLARPEATYQSEDTPEGVVHNYLLALQEEDYERAYGYLYPDLDGYPGTLEAFIDDVKSHSWTFRLYMDVSLSVDSAKITYAYDNPVRAEVEVREERFYGGDLFDSGQSIRTFDMQLVFIEGEWKIYDGDQYFRWCWGEARGCQ